MCAADFTGAGSLAVGASAWRAALALGLGLARHRVLHPLRDLDVLDLDRGDLHPPRLGLIVDDLLDSLAPNSLGTHPLRTPT